MKFEPGSLSCMIIRFSHRISGPCQLVSSFSYIVPLSRPADRSFLCFAITQSKPA